MKCPYNAFELNLALIKANSVFEKIDKKGKLSELEKRLDELKPPEGAQLKPAVAAFHGITVKELIDSPNYKTLSQEYFENRIAKVLETLKEYGIDDKTGWALLTKAMDILPSLGDSFK